MFAQQSTAQRHRAWLTFLLLCCAPNALAQPAAPPVSGPTTPSTPSVTPVLPAGAPSAEAAPAVDVPTEGDATPSVEPTAPAARVVLVYTQAIGVDPVVARFVNEQLATTAGGLGYQLVQGEETARFAQQVTLPYPPGAADLWRLTYASSSQRGVFARVWAEGGQYVTEVLVASLDGTGPFVQRATSGAADLQSVVHNLLLQTLAPPSTQPLVPPAPSAVTQPAAAPAPVTLATPLPELSSSATERPPIDHRWLVAVQTEGAFGAGGQFFYNHLLGTRVDYRFTHELSGGLYFGYANLRGRNERISNALMYLQVENRIAVTPDGPLTIPLRLGFGYLPRNGPVLRLASGLFYALSPRTRIGAEVLVPTFWVIRDRVLFSMDFAVELGFTL